MESTVLYHHAVVWYRGMVIPGSLSRGADILTDPTTFTKEIPCEKQRIKWKKREKGGKCEKERSFGSCSKHLMGVHQAVNGRQRMQI